ncbi:hypothetical protein TREPR_3388 [Treponema primitia ZAS-2]|uniref:Bacterial surface antigen (D15) domain-containing protein n=1 Tax=Treponema primitia (strain ATCC BAA-887 / DSM 12427 / ZAS-2) TaxID=545694 RepID=F5YJM5_TREPZ|nr:hypothetical protein [Treponema primitia]AEF85091.1 hypothetical protein TREPR_3388 [Treponema primitia ZAS-2]
MVKKAGFSFLFVLMVFPGLCLYPQAAELSPDAAAEAGDVRPLVPRIITAVSITGLKRTKLYVAEYPLKKYIGYDAATLDINQVTATIMNTGILEPVSIAINEAPDSSGMILVVEVREKWAFFPIPVFFLDSDGGIRGGAALMDANAFGLNDKFIVAGLYGNSGWFATVIYQYTPEREHFPGWSIMGMYGRQNQRDTDQKKRDLRRYDQESIMGSVGVQYPLKEPFTLSASTALIRRNILKTENPLRVPDEGAFGIRVNPSLSASASHWDGFLLSEQSASLEYTLTTLFDSDPLHSALVRGNYEFPIIPGFQAGLRGGLYYTPKAPPLFESSSNAVGINILPATFSARNYAGAAVEFEKYLFKFSQGTLAAQVSYQVIYSYGPILGHQFDHGVSGAISFYLSRIAIPALGIGVSYNVAAEEFQGTFSMGMSF